MKKGFENAERLVVRKDGKTFAFQATHFTDPITNRPFESLSDLNFFLNGTNMVGVICILNEAPCKEWENAARKLDGKHYSKDCFVLKGVIGMNPETSGRMCMDWEVWYIGKDYELMLERGWNIEKAGEYAWYVYDLVNQMGDIKFHMD